MFKNTYIYMFSFLLFLLSLINFFFMLYLIMNNNMIMLIEWEMITLNSCSLVMIILIDWMSTLFMSFVMLISSMVIFYSKNYMNNEINLNRFIFLILLFIFSMLMLIISPNLITILLGWDGLGLVSYCLVIYYQNINSFNSGMLTALSNRIGDVMILLSIAWMLNYGSWNYLFYLELMKIDNEMKYLMLFMILAAMTKSAQIPFSSWLPAAMAAPTPVSALVHSSTLVTAGVYLMIRFNILLNNMFFFKILLFLSSLTMFMAGISANFEFDLKKIIALSTLSQLGLMMSILSMGYNELAFFHLLTHAMFKALLFMCAGNIIHMMMNKQDIRFMGGLVNFIPLTSLCFNISNLALCGIPFLAGFYSKDLILEMICLNNMNMFVFFLYYISTGLTMFYTMRLLFYLMLNDFNLMGLFNLFDENYDMLLSMFILMLNSIIMGCLIFWVNLNVPYMIYLPFNLKMMVMYSITMGSLLGYFFSSIKLYLFYNLKFMHMLVKFKTLMWFMPNLSTYGMNIYFMKLGYLYNIIDFFWIEYFSSQGIYNSLKKHSILNQFMQLNNFKLYLFNFILWMFIFYYWYLYYLIF